MKRNSRGGDAFVEYWERTVPWVFKKEKLPYEERRRLRYDLQDYMLGIIPFTNYRGKRVLEIGSGSGIDSTEFGRNGADVVSLDFTETGSKSTRDTLAQAGVTSWNVVRAAAQHLPFREGVFSCVYSFGVLHHIPDVDPVMSEISKVLSAQGELVCMLYNKESLLYAYSILFLHRDGGLTEEEMVSRYSERVEGCPYTKAYTTEDARRLLSDSFREISISVHYSVIDTPEERKVKLHLGDEYQLGWHLIVKGKRAGRHAKAPGRQRIR